MTKHEEIMALRRECANYMYEMSQIKWTPSETIDFSDFKKTLVYEKGKTYYGIIYNTLDGVNLEQFKENLNSQNEFTGPTDRKVCAGNHCTSSIIRSWQHIGDKTTANWSRTMMPISNRGIYKVGDYKFTQTDEPLKQTTAECIAENTPEIMYEAYAKLQIADAVLSAWDKTGHGRMVLSVQVIRDNDGKINPELSEVICLEQTWDFDVQSNVNTTWFVNHRYSFEKLYSKNWIPITVKSFIEE